MSLRRTEYEDWKQTSLILFLVFCTYAFIIVKYAEKFSGDFSGFICLGERYALHAPIPKDLFVFRGTPGYDGQFFYMACFDPWIRGDMHAYMDTPAYRYQRMLYPLLASWLAAGKPDFFPYTLVIVNVVFILVGTYYSIKLLGKMHLNPYWSFFYALNFGFLFCVFRDLATPVALGLLVGGFYFYESRHMMMSMVLFSLSILTRELMFIPIAGIVIYEGTVQRDWKKAGCLALSLVPFILWQGYIYDRIGSLPFGGGKLNFGMPLVDVWNYLKQCLSDPNPKRNIEKLFAILFILLWISTLIISIRAILITFRLWTTYTLILFAGLSLFLTKTIWVEPWSYSRVLSPFFTLLFIHFMHTREKILWVPLFLIPVLFCIALIWVELF